MPRLPCPRLLAAALAATAFVPAGCYRTVDPPAEVPAVVVEPTAESRTELSDAVRAALGGREVPLATDALERTSTLVVERAPARDPQGRRLDGRARSRPERFHLLKSGRACTLVHEGSGRRFPLPATRCAPH